MSANKGTLVAVMCLPQLRKELMGQFDETKDQVKGVMQKMLQQSVVEKKLINNVLAANNTKKKGKKISPDSHPKGSVSPSITRPSFFNQSYNQPRPSPMPYGGMQRRPQGPPAPSNVGGPRGGCYTCGGAHLQRDCPTGRNSRPARFLSCCVPSHKNYNNF